MHEQLYSQLLARRRTRFEAVVGLAVMATGTCKEVATSDSICALPPPVPTARHSPTRCARVARRPRRLVAASRVPYRPVSADPGRGQFPGGRSSDASRGYFVVRQPIPDLLKFAIIAAGAFAVCAALYELLVRRINVLRFLFGMKLQSKASRARPPS